MVSTRDNTRCSNGMPSFAFLRGVVWIRRLVIEKHPLIAFVQSSDRCCTRYELCATRSLPSVSINLSLRFRPLALRSALGSFATLQSLIARPLTGITSANHQYVSSNLRYSPRRGRGPFRCNRSAQPLGHLALTCRAGRCDEQVRPRAAPVCAPAGQRAMPPG